METPVKIYYLRIFFLSFEPRIAIELSQAIAKLYYGLIDAIKMCGRKRERDYIVEENFTKMKLLKSFYYENYCKYGLSYDWKVYYYDDSDVIARSRLMSMHL